MKLQYGRHAYAIRLGLSLLMAALPLYGCSSGSETTGSEPASSMSASEVSSVDEAASSSLSTTTERPTTTPAPTTTLLAPSTENLFYMMPSASDLPPGWTTSGGLPDGSLQPAAGNGIGTCGGPNLDMRAVANNVVASLWSPSISTPKGGTFYFAIYAFPNSDKAKDFLDSTRALVQCPSFPEYTMKEGSGPGEYDGFEGTFGEGRVTWHVQESTAMGQAGETGADDSFAVQRSKTYSTRYGGISYGSKSTTWGIYEQRDKFAFVSWVTGSCCSYGYNNSATASNYTPTFDDLRAGLDAIRPAILHRMGQAHLLP